MIPELLAPAGGMRQFKTAVRFGADAIYCGLKSYGLRARSTNLTFEELGEAVGFAHAYGVKVFVTLNIIAFDQDVAQMVISAQKLYDLGVDAVIVADAGAVSEIHSAVPKLPIHLSTQANTTNAAACRFWHKNGVKRIVLARELSLEQIVEIRKNVPDTLELEAFVHGAVCMAYSGRCALSAYMTGRDANRGDCAQACRWNYKLIEEKRPQESYPVEESERGVQIFSARDLNMIEHIPELCASGLNSLKIEGRMKTEYYTATVVGAYRRALDAIAEDPAQMQPNAPLVRELIEELNKASHRLSDTGFYFGHPQVPGEANGFLQDAEFVGFILEQNEQGFAQVDLRNRIVTGDKLELMTPNGVFPFQLKGIGLPNGSWCDSYGVAKTIVSIEIPHRAETGDLLRGPCRNHKSNK